MNTTNVETNKDSLVSIEKASDSLFISPSNKLYISQEYLKNKQLYFICGVVLLITIIFK